MKNRLVLAAALVAAIGWQGAYAQERSGVPNRKMLNYASKI